MAEGARLESVYTFTGIEGSNPSLSDDKIDPWRSGRVVEGGRLESDYTGNGIGGSNPPSSV